MLYRKLFWKTLFALEIRATKLVLLTSSPPEALLPTPPFCQLSLRRRWASATNHGYPGYPQWPCPEAGGSGILVLSDELNHRSIVEGGTFFQQKQVEHASTKISTFAYFKTIHGYTCYIMLHLHDLSNICSQTLCRGFLHFSDLSNFPTEASDFREPRCVPLRLGGPVNFTDAATLTYMVHYIQFIPKM